jgi:hypothetical protein
MNDALNDALNNAPKKAPRVIDTGRARHADPVTAVARMIRTAGTTGTTSTTSSTRSTRSALTARTARTSHALDLRGPDNVAPKAALRGNRNPRWAPLTCPWGC